MKNIVKKALLSLILFLNLLLTIALGISIYFRVASVIRETDTSEKVAPASGKFISFNNEKIFVQDTGPAEGSILIFIHGTGSWSELWKPTMEFLATQGFRSIAIDSPPFGFSGPSESATLAYDRQTQAQRILAVMDALQIQQATLIGHSFGGRATVTVALENPGRVQKLILVNIALGFGPSVGEDPIPVAGGVQYILETDYIRNTIAAIGSHPALTKTLVEGFVANPASVTEEITKLYQRPLSLRGKKFQIGDWLKEFLLSTDHQLVKDPSQYQKFQFPTVLIWGAADTITPLWQAQAIQRMLPFAEFKTIESVGHIPMIEAGETFQKMLLESL
jgi:pimeloyl-ACP methyl ester carboxylesterase